MPHGGRRPAAVDEVVLEELEAVETRGRDRLELLPQRAAHRHGGDRSAHRRAASVRALVLIWPLRAAPRAWWSGNRRTRGRPESSRTACRCPPGTGQPFFWAARRNGVYLLLHYDFADEGLGGTRDVDGQGVAVLHAERCCVDDDVVAGRILRAGPDFDLRIVLVQAAPRASAAAACRRRARCRHARGGKRCGDRRPHAAGADDQARAPSSLQPLRLTPRTKPAPSNMSPSSVPSGA